MLGVADDLLRRLIVERGWLSADDLDAAAREQEEQARRMGVAPFLGTVLLCLGKLSPDRLQELLAAGVRQAIEAEEAAWVKEAVAEGAVDERTALLAQAEALEPTVPRRAAEILVERGTVSRAQQEAIASRGTEAVSIRRFGRYQVLARLGKGGMGEVYQALQPGLGRLVAIKVLPPELQHDREFVERFNREAQALARLNHPNIVTVHEFGVEEGRYYFVMELVDGTNLRQLLRDGKLPPERALRIVPQVCDALEYAHEEGVVHRDVKPENILVDRKGRVKIADFGIARVIAPAGSTQRLTSTGLILGTPHYMAPEQVEDPTKVDHRADIYSLGVVFYEMLTGQLPLGRFDAPSRKAAVDARVDDVVLKALEREPERRYQRAALVKEDVGRIAPTGRMGAESDTALGAAAAAAAGSGPGAAAPAPTPTLGSAATRAAVAPAPAPALAPVPSPAPAPLPPARAAWWEPAALAALAAATTAVYFLAPDPLGGPLALGLGVVGVASGSVAWLKGHRATAGLAAVVGLAAVFGAYGRGLGPAAPAPSPSPPSGPAGPAAALPGPAGAPGAVDAEAEASALFERLLVSERDLPRGYRVEAQPKKLSRNPLVAKSPEEVREALDYLDRSGLRSLSTAEVRRAYLVGIGETLLPACAVLELTDEAAARRAEAAVDVAGADSPRFVHRRGRLLVYIWRDPNRAVEVQRFLFEHLVRVVGRRLGLPDADPGGLRAFYIPDDYAPPGFSDPGGYASVYAGYGLGRLLGQEWGLPLGAADVERLYWCRFGEYVEGQGYAAVDYVVARVPGDGPRAALLARWRRMGAEPLERAPFAGFVLPSLALDDVVADPEPLAARTRAAARDLLARLADRLGVAVPPPAPSLERLALEAEELPEGTRWAEAPLYAPNPRLARDPADVRVLLEALRFQSEVPVDLGTVAPEDLRGAFRGHVDPGAVLVAILEAKDEARAPALEAALRRALEAAGPRDDERSRVLRSGPFVALLWQRDLADSPQWREFGRLAGRLQLEMGAR